MELANNSHTGKKYKISRKRFLASEQQLTAMKELLIQGKTQEEMADILNIGRNFFYTSRNNPKHPQYKIMSDIFGPVRRRIKESVKAQSLNANSIIDDSVQKTFNNFAIKFVCEYIMTSDNSQINTHDKIVVEEYNKLKDALKGALRLEDKNDPMYVHAKSLYDEITNQLINVARKIYDERQDQDQDKPLQKP